MKNNAKRFAREFLFINLVSFTGACIIFLFQFLISKVKELVFLPIKTTPINIVIYRERNFNPLYQMRSFR